MKERQDGKPAFLPRFALVEPKSGLDSVVVEIAVAEHRPFRNAGRAAGILEDRSLMRIDIDRFETAFLKQ